jgi:hypothetical protein
MFFQVLQKLFRGWKTLSVHVETSDVRYNKIKNYENYFRSYPKDAEHREQ